MSAKRQKQTCHFTREHDVRGIDEAVEEGALKDTIEVTPRTDCHLSSNGPAQHPSWAGENIGDVRADL